MRPLRPFQWFVTEGIASTKTPDRVRASSLLDAAAKRKEARNRMQASIPIDDTMANTYVENCYDELMALSRAILLLEGYVARGEGAHEAEVTYLKEIGLSETSVRQLNELRAIRNGILYYGENSKEEYAKKIVELSNELGPKLRAECSKRGVQ